MSRKNSQFFIYVPAKSGHLKGTRLLGVNHLYKGGTEDLSVADLLAFLKEKQIDPSDVRLPSSFSTTTVLSLSTQEITALKPVGKPVKFQTAVKIPGIYKLQDFPSSAALIVTSKGRILYVNDNVVDDTLYKDYASTNVWKTKSSVPFKIRFVD
jgi:hypothetical protein